MSKRDRSEYGNNAQIRRGVVADRDPKTMRVKVRFEDEDDVVTQWVDVTGGSSLGNSYFSMPGKEDEVWVAMDAKGEGGCILGSRYNSKEAPPYNRNGDIAIRMEGGFLHLDTAAGTLSIKLTSISVELDNLTVKGNVDFQDGYVKSNGKRVDDTHGHVTAPPGPPGPPV